MDLIEIFKIIILGIIEGITEWLPISSTGHMILVDEFIKINVSEEFMEMFRVVIQLGAIMAVVILYFNKLNPISPKKTFDEKKNTFLIWAKVIIACFPLGIVGVLFEDKVDELFYNYKVVAVTLILYGILFILVENRKRNEKSNFSDISQLTYKMAFIIGLFQVLSIVPGTSRSGVTILGAILIGASRFIAAEFSFYLAIPVMFGASALKIVKFGFSYSENELIALILGMIVAFIVSVLAIKFLVGYIKKKDFKVFGYYRIILGILVLLYFL